MGVSDELWGEQVGMICRMKAGSQDLTLKTLRTWCEDRLARYKIPSRLLLVDEIPKNAMGKVNKKTLVKLFRQKTTEQSSNECKEMITSFLVLAFCMQTCCNPI